MYSLTMQHSPDTDVQVDACMLTPPRLMENLAGSEGLVEPEIPGYNRGAKVRAGASDLVIFLQVSLGLRFKGLILDTVGILYNVEFHIRQLWCPSVISYNITSISCNH